MNNLVENTRINAEVELEYMTLEEKLNEFKAEGREEGIAEGEKNTRIETATKMIQKGKYSVSEIVELTQLSEEDVERIAQELKNSTENAK